MPYLGKSPSQGVRTRYLYTATANQTTFSGTDTQNLTLTYSDSNFIDVHQNGVLLKVVDDYTATSGTSVVLGTGATADDVVEIIVYDVFSVGNFYNRTDSDSRYALTTGATMSGALDLNGQELVLDVDGDTSITSDTDDQIDIKVAGSDKVVISSTSHLSTTTAGTSNLVLGVNAGNSIQSGGNYNTALGDEAGTAITTGDENTLVGYVSGDAITTGIRNVAVGSYALSTNVAGDQSVAVGHGALFTQNPSGNDDMNNVAVGHDAGNQVTTGKENTFVGSLAGDAITSSNYNTALGSGALGADDLGSFTTAIGRGALGKQNYASATNSFNTAVGANAGEEVTTGTQNTLIGALVGDAITTGEKNTAVGYDSLTALTAGDRNTAVGKGTLATYNVTDGSEGYNTAIGHDAGNDLTTGNANTFVGGDAGDKVTTGSRNTLVGYDAGYGVVMTGTANILIGDYVRVSGTSESNATAIGGQVSGEGGYFTIGSGTDDIRAAHGNTTWSTVSDERVKKDIVDSTAGLSFINDLKPRTFKYRTKGDIPDTFIAYEKDSTEVLKNSLTNHGFIAQEVKTVIDNHSEIKDGFRLWDERKDGQQEVAETALIPILVKAVQELSAKNDALEARIKKLEDG